MADFSIVGLQAAVVGVATTVHFKIQSTAEYTITTTNGTVRLGDLNLSSDVTATLPGVLGGRRPTQGQVFPRGVYNK